MEVDAERDDLAVLREHVGLLTLRATEVLYAQQPDLWKMGEQGRQHTFQDFGYHFRALAPLDATVFAHHVDYCRDLFAKRGFPLTWLDDAWRVMEAVLRSELDDELAGRAVEVLHEGLGS